MVISCGTLIMDYDDNILLGKSTGNDFWDIPKGIMDSGESFIDTAVRECKEEFGLDLPRDKMKDIGLFDYNRYKMLYLFQLKVEELPDTSVCYCSSFFDLDDARYLEISDYGVFNIDDAIQNKVCRSMASVLRKIRGVL